MEGVLDMNGSEVRVDDIVRTRNGKLLQVKGWAHVSDPTNRGVHVAASDVELIVGVSDGAQMVASQTPGEQTILWGLEPPPPPPE